VPNTLTINPQILQQLKHKIDVLLVDGVYYGFSGCHRFEAHQRLGLTHIRCRVMRASKETLRMHLM
jgi:sulfiredoxin